MNQPLTYPKTLCSQFCSAKMHRIASQFVMLSISYENELTNSGDKMIEVMRSHFASIPYDWHRKNNIDQYEGYYARVFYSYFASIGVEMKAEEPTSYGKVDMAVVMPKVVYVFEFKVIEGEEGTGEALEQIKKKGYGDRYKGICRGVLQYAPIYLIGIEFSKTKRQIVGFYTERLK